MKERDAVFAAFLGKDCRMAMFMTTPFLPPTQRHTSLCMLPSLLEGGGLWFVFECVSVNGGGRK